MNATYGDDYFFGGGPGYRNYLSEADLLRRHGRRYGELLTRHTPPGTLLDVGAAAGFVLQGMCEAGWQGRGVEPNPAMARHAREHLGLRVDTGTFEDLHDATPVQLVTMIQVAAHFYDVDRAFGTAARLTRPDGWLLVETWDRASLTARLFGHAWHEYTPPSVLHWFTRASLEALARRHGFERVAVGRPVKRLNAGHAKSLLQYKLRGRAVGRLVDTLGRVLPDHLNLPYPSEDLFWMLLRRSPRAGAHGG